MPTEACSYRFEHLVDSVGADEFLRRYLGTNLLHMSGHPGRWHQLVKWTELNRFLERTRSRGRLRMFRDGVRLDPGQYLETNEETFGRLAKPLAIERELRAGASLVLNSAEELCDGLYEMWHSLRRTFQAPVEAALFLSLGTVKGLDLHWDPLDAFVVQIRGRKRWQVYKPTMTNPVAQLKSDTPKPAGPPDWEGTLVDGDVLYMPQGWWHAPAPLDDLSLHVTFAVYRPTGIDVIKWLLNTAVENASLRAPLPSIASSEEQQRYADNLKAVICQELGRNSVEAYFRWVESEKCYSRTSHIPQPPAAPIWLITPDTTFLLTDRHRLHFVRREEGVLAFNAGGTQWQCEAGLRDALALLSDTDAVSFGALTQVIAASQRMNLRSLLTALSMRGAVAGH